MSSQTKDTSIKREVACCIVRGLAEFWKCEELQDFTVTVGSVHFGCHRLVLASCSEFFRGMFRSGMQETEQKSVHIKEMSSETFALILESMYTGHGVLTNDNVVDIWRAAHQLLIHFLLTECENFVINTLSMENYAEFLYISKTLNSAAVLDSLWSFVLKNCNSFFQTSYFLELPLADVLRLIQSQDLETKSEDDVIHAILKWAESRDNRAQFSEVTGDDGGYSCEKEKNEENEVGKGNRACSTTCRKFSDTSTVSGTLDKNVMKDSRVERHNQGTDVKSDVTLLLSYARICLASQRSLETLLSNPLVRDNKEVRDIVIEASLYQLHEGKRNGPWPSRAVHRNNSKFLHCIVIAETHGASVVFKAYSMARKKWYVMKHLIDDTTIQLAVVNNELYALTIRLSEEEEDEDIQYIWPYTIPPRDLRLLRLTNGNDVKTFCHFTDDLHAAVVNSFVYIVSAHEQRVWEVDVASVEISEKSRLPGREKIAYVMAYDQSILVFHASTGEGAGDAVVRCYDTSHNTWTKVNNLDGPADGMTSFIDDQSTYLLQSNGNMWKVVKPQSNIIDFELVSKLWNCDLSLHGAATFLGELYIGFQPAAGLPNGPQLMRALPGVFRAIIYLEIKSDERAILTPVLLSENDFRKSHFPGYNVSRFTRFL